MLVLHEAKLEVRSYYCTKRIYKLRDKYFAHDMLINTAFSARKSVSLYGTTLHAAAERHWLAVSNSN